MLETIFKLNRHIQATFSTKTMSNTKASYTYTIMRLLSFLSFFFITSLSFGQTYSAKVLDAKTQKPIPYATIQYGTDQGVISNDEGSFSFTIEEQTEKLDSVYITCLGYQKTGVTFGQLQDSVLYVAPKAIELGGVYVFNKNLSVAEILEKMKENLSKNHRKSFLKKRFFLRQSYYDRLLKSQVTFKKSTIKELNKQLIDSTMSVIPKKAAYFTETLGDYFWNPNESKESKMEVLRAAELYDKNNELSLEGLQERFEKILNKSVKKDSYLKIKSGWFSTKVQVDSILEYSNDSLDIDESLGPGSTSFLPNRKRTMRVMHDRMWAKKTNLDVIKKSNKYEFSLKGFDEVDDQGVYVLSFRPKRSADFSGLLYVNVEDFAIMRIDYKNVKLLRNFKLLGISQKSHTYQGSTVYSKAPEGDYTLKFATFTFGSTTGVKRPLKIVEKNKNVKGRRKQNELKMDVHFINEHRSVYELVVYDVAPTSKNGLHTVTEGNTIKPTYLPAYDPNFWQGYTIMEPNQAIREFTVEAE